MTLKERPNTTSVSNNRHSVADSETWARRHSLRQTGLALAGLFLICCPLFFFQLGGWGFFDADEGRYGEIPREMLAQHDFITPTLNYVKFFDKPPLLYWAIAAMYSMFGLHEWAARLIPALAALMGLLVTYALGRRMFGPRAGFLSALILATNPMWPLMARTVLTDMLVSSLVFVSLALWWMGHSEEKSRQARCFIGFWMTLALAVLAKGPVAVVLVGGSIVFYLVLCRQWKSLAAMRWGLGVPLFLVIAVPWFVLVAQHNPEFNHFFWYEQHIGRFTGRASDRDHVNGRLYFLEFLPLIFFPWSVFMPVAVAAGWKRVWPIRHEKQRAAVYLGCGCAFITLFFSASDSKLVTYILPVLPLLAILLAAYFDRLLAAAPAIRLRPLAMSAAFLSLLLAAVGIAAIVAGPKKLQTMDVSGGMAVVMGILLLVWAVALMVATWRYQAAGIIAAVAGGFVVVFTGIIMLITAIAPHITTKPLLAAIRPGLGENTEIASLGFTQSLSFYTQRRIHVEGKPDELAYGLEHMDSAEKRRWFFKGRDDLRRLMSQPTPVYCVIRRSRNKGAAVQKALDALQGQASEIVRNYRFSIIGNRAALKLTPPEKAQRTAEQ